MYTCHMADWKRMNLTTSSRKRPCVLPPSAYKLYVLHSLFKVCWLPSQHFPLSPRRCISVCPFFCWPGISAPYPPKPVATPGHVISETKKKVIIILLTVLIYPYILGDSIIINTILWFLLWIYVHTFLFPALNRVKSTLCMV